jgi:hypothetical protein
MYILSSTELPNSLVFLKNTNPFANLLKTYDHIKKSIVFRKHVDFSLRLKLNYLDAADFLTIQQTELLKVLYDERSIRYPDFNILNNRHYNNYLSLNNKANPSDNVFLVKFFLKYGYFIFDYFKNKDCRLNSNNKVLNINFLKKERLYTKLKYSRSPAYDIVSGGSAALLAAFLGFLITEKYGFELIDSGDFYYFFIYIVFISFSIKLVVSTLNSRES